MKLYRYFIISLLIIMVFAENGYCLSMSSHVIEQFKKTITQCCHDALFLKGEFKNNGYYVNLNNEVVKGYTFSNVIVKFENLNDSKRNELLNNLSFSELQNNVQIKVAADISPNEFQQIINNEIGRSSIAKRVFNQADFNFDYDSVTVSGTLNLKRVPGNPFALVSNDGFSPFRAKLSANIVGTNIYISIIDGEVNGQEMSNELKQVFLNWLNPLWDFSKLGFDCEIKEYKITPQGLRIVGTVF